MSEELIFHEGEFKSIEDFNFIDEKVLEEYACRFYEEKNDIYSYLVKKVGSKGGVEQVNIDVTAGELDCTCTRVHNCLHKEVAVWHFLKEEGTLISNE